MAFALVYRIEFINFEENTIRIDIQSGNVPSTTGNTLSVPTNIAFSNSGGFIQILTYTTAFFYVGMTFSVSGSASNDGVYTVTSLTGSVGGPLTIFVPQAMTDEYVGIGPVVFTDTSTTDPQVITLQGTGTPLVISTINNDQNKYQPIRSKQAVIQFVSDSGIPADISTFSTGPDNKWTVDISIIGVTPFLFRGFLIMSDNQQPFQPDPQTVQLTATDHLGVLKDVALVDYQGNNPRGVYRIADLIMMCLRKTGVILDLYVVNNLRVGSGDFSVVTTFQATDSVIITPITNTFFYIGQTFTVTGTASNDGTYTVKDLLQEIFTLVKVVGTLVDEATVVANYSDTNSPFHCYDIARLDAKSFEKEINLSEDCYTVLSKILGKDCYVCQWAGAWWIMRVDEFNEFPIYTAHFDNSGVYVGIDSGAAYNISIGALETRRFANADTLLQFIRPHGQARLEYPFELPLEIPDNVDFDQGALTDDISSVEKHYNLDLWRLSKDVPPTTLDNTSFILRKFFNDSEIERYAVIGISGVDALYNLESSAIPVNFKDKFDISVDVKWSGSFDYSVVNVMQVRLYGSDGSHWILNGGRTSDDVVEWRLSDANWTTNNTYFVVEDGSGDDSEKWKASTFWNNAPCPEIPVEGYITILLVASTGTDTRETHFSNLRWDYIPFINGSYQKYTSYTNEINRIASGYLETLEEEVNVEDGPNRLTKGAIQIPGVFTEIISDNIDFVGPNSILIPGNVTVQIYQGLLIRISGTTNNDGVYLVTSVTYHLIPDNTEVTVFETVITETSAAGISVGAMALTRNWYSAQPLALAINTDPANVHPYGYIQIYSVWNQFRGSDNTDGEGMGINIFTGSVIGLTTSWPDLLHKYLLTDTNQQTNARYFMLLSMSQDWKSCIWTATLAEVFNTVAGRNYLDTETFKYIAE